ncbi:hypothetical protein EV1_043821 [Malus domestica]
MLSFHSFDLELVRNSEREFLGFKSNSFCWVDLIVQSALFSACFFCTAGRHELRMNWQIVSTCFELTLHVTDANTSGKALRQTARDFRKADSACDRC